MRSSQPSTSQQPLGIQMVEGIENSSYVEVNGKRNLHPVLTSSLRQRSARPSGTVSSQAALRGVLWEQAIEQVT